MNIIILLYMTSVISYFAATLMLRTCADICRYIGNAKRLALIEINTLPGIYQEIANQIAQMADLFH